MKSTLVIYDVNRDDEKLILELEDNFSLFSATPMVRDCVGCFGCWVKTPAKCVIKDRCNMMPKLISHSEEVIIITPILYGGYSKNIKAVLDRSIGYVLPYFRIVKGEMHHQLRYKKSLSLRVFFYGECDAKEKEIAYNLVRANAVNLGADSYSTLFCDNMDSIRKAMQ